jgi:branched-chain amino acid transport system substrate-binding protein
VAGFDVNKADECARRAVDGGYLAFVGGGFPSGDSYIKILEEAGIPLIGHNPLAPYEYVAPLSYPVTAGTMGLALGGVACLADVHGATDIVLSYTDTAAGQSLIELGAAALSARGMDWAELVPVTRNAPDHSAEVQRAADVSNTVLNAATGADLAQWAALAAQQGMTQAIYDKALAPAIREALGPDVLANDNVCVISLTATDDMDVQGITDYLADQASIDPSLPSEAQAKEAWAGADLFAEIASRMTEATAAGVVEALNSITDFDAGGMLPPIDFSQTGLEDYPSVRNHRVLFSSVNEENVFVTGASNGEFVDPLVPAGE